MLDRRTLLASGLVAILPAVPTLTAQDKHYGWRDECVRLTCGRKIGIRQFGDPAGQPVFYFHGLPGSRMEAGLIGDEVESSGVRLIAMDRPGMGNSSQYDRRRICDWPRDVLQIAKYYGYSERQFGVIGMSGGAPYAAVCARMIPERLNHVAIVSGHTPMCNVSLCPEGNKDHMLRCSARHPRLGKIGFNSVRRRMQRNPHKTIEGLTEAWTEADRKLVLSNSCFRNLMVEEICEAMRCGVEGIYTEVHRLACDWGFRLCDIQHPSISIWQGGCDQLTPPSMGNYFHQQISGSELFVDAAGGHITNLKCNASEILSRFHD